ncbi:ABC transporter substrate-binding protein [Paenibacillus yonginensis]|uniref:ABC transporter substrate-binding protein n=1 Tax=Paenibacillus yonginensis TaxID=1462996 RepID=A0A1B1N5G1_9BACL|nr:ABC transporter substrate-binding protein [Paenibacillus yonginensis]ANS76688.1 ABC transporter substrate-binding protein [Paenibacillus yonginensis]
MLNVFKKKTGRTGFVLLSLLILTLVLSACGSSAANNSASSSNTSNAAASTEPSDSTAPSEAAERTIKDAMGHDVKIPANPQRVLASYLEDHLVALGVKPVAQWSVADGKSIQDYLQSSLSGVPTIAYDLPPEQVASFNPDLIIIDSESAVEKGLYEQYSAIAPTYVLGDAVRNDWRKSLTTIGDLLGKSAEAEKVLADYDQKAADTKSTLEAAGLSGQSAAVLWITQKAVYTVKDSVASGNVLYHDLGFSEPSLVTDISKAAQADWNPVPVEQLSKLDADHIFVMNSDGPDSETIKSPIWQGLKAVKNGNVHEISASGGWMYKGAVAGGQIMDDVLSNLVK